MDKQNGKLIILSRANIMGNAQFADDGMEELCKKYNVQVANDFVLGYSQRNVEDVLAVRVEVPRMSQHKVAKEFSKNRLIFFTPRTLRSSDSRISSVGFIASRLVPSGAETFTSNSP